MGVLHVQCMCVFAPVSEFVITMCVHFCFRDLLTDHSNQILNFLKIFLKCYVISLTKINFHMYKM